MHIGVVSDTQFKHDPRIRNEVSYLTSQDHEASVLNVAYAGTTSPQSIEGSLVYDVVISKRWQNKFRAIQNILPVYERFWAQKIREFIEEVDPDVLHVHDLYMAKAAKKAIEDSSIPIVLDLHENFPAAIQSYRWANKYPKKLLVQPKKWIKKEGKYLSYADKLIVLSEHFKNVLCDKYAFLSRENVFVYPNVPDRSQFSTYPIESIQIGKENDIVLFYFGAIAYRRGIHTVMEALRRIIPQDSRFHLLLIGPIDRADREMFNRYFADPVLKDHITYHAWKDIKEFPNYVKASDIGLSPLIKNDQHESGIANKVYQYMLFERPVIVSNCRPQQRLIEESQCGWVFESENVDDLINVLQEVSKSEDLAELGKNGQEVVERVENLENRGKSLSDLYLKISKGL